MRSKFRQLQPKLLPVVCFSGLPTVQTRGTTTSTASQTLSTMTAGLNTTARPNISAAPCPTAATDASAGPRKSFHEKILLEYDYIFGSEQYIIFNIYVVNYFFLINITYYPLKFESIFILMPTLHFDE